MRSRELSYYLQNKISKTKFDLKVKSVKSDFKFNLDSESIALLTEINRLVNGMACFEEGWNSDNESLVLQLYELFERADSTITKITKNYPPVDVRFWSNAFDLLTVYLSIQSGEELQSVVDRVLLDRYKDRYTDRELTDMEPMIGFALAYHMFGLDNEEGLANALTYLEATIGN